MNSDAARELVWRTLQAPFDKGRFAELTRNILDHATEAPLTYAGNYIYADFRGSIAHLERLSKYTSPQGKRLDVLVVHLSQKTSLERARATQRNFVAKYLQSRKIIKDGALVAFIPATGEDWRFSFVKMEYRIDKQSRVKEDLSPARRYSFLVGSNENSHTAQSRLLPLLQGRDPTLADLEEAFGVEQVTKEFFGKYRDLFLRLEKALDEIIATDTRVAVELGRSGVNNADFAKKLLGQIVFLYFLQKKGWFGVRRGQEWGQGSRDFLRALFGKRHGDYSNFFNDILEPLFYEALCDERTDDYFSRFDCRIPFLNGGLFDPIGDYNWTDPDIPLPNKLFCNQNKTAEGDTGDGIFDIFDRYNFTVKEDEPLEKEVAVDPEMLGKVFENLLVVKERKAKGTYYTPREIVHYMCQQSLIDYLYSECNRQTAIDKQDIETLIRHGESFIENERRVMDVGHETQGYVHKMPENIRTNAARLDTLLANIRVCDPAVGSGAFPVGMMNEIVRSRNALTLFVSSATTTADNTERSTYHFKRHAIQNCLYGVDVDSGAVEIAKLRLWLSLIVDEVRRETIQPLPNLDYKIIQGNSLLSVERNLLNDEDFVHLEALKRHYFSETGIRGKKQHREEIGGLIVAITDGHKDFDFRVYFSEVFHEKKGFDVVIANPPYLQLSKLKKMGDAAVYEKYRQQNYTTYTATGDIYCLFYEQGLRIVRDAGLLCYISSNKWMRASYGQKLRQFFVKYNPAILIDLGPDVFETATVDTNVIVVQKIPNRKQTQAMSLYRHGAGDIGAALNSNAVTLSNLSADGWTLANSQTIALLSKLRTAGTPLGEYVQGRLYRGIITGYNDAFVIDTATRARLIAEDPNSEELIKPWLRGKDIKKWRSEWAGVYIIAIPQGWTNANCGKKNAEQFFSEKYPTVHGHLKSIGDSGSGKGQGLYRRDDQGDYWWEMRPCTYYSEFAKPKIIYSVIGKTMRALFDSHGYLTNDKCFIVPEADEHLTAVLNSRVVDFYCRFAFPTLGNPWRGGGIEFRGVFMEKLPIPRMHDGDKSAIDSRVHAITAAMHADPAADVSQLESEIDAIVYRLYALTAAEIRLIESAYTGE